MSYGTFNFVESDLDVTLWREAKQGTPDEPPLPELPEDPVKLPPGDVESEFSILAGTLHPAVGVTLVGSDVDQTLEEESLRRGHHQGEVKKSLIEIPTGKAVFQKFLASGVNRDLRFD